MAQYKVPQDVEADDKLIGPFSFRQFVYLLLAFGLGALAFGLFQIFPLLAAIPVPFILLLLALALPLKKDQPMETYLAALISYFLKPRVRLWRPGQRESTIMITAPKVVDASASAKGLTEEEATRRLSFLADLVDTGGYAIKGASNSSVREDLLAEATQADDIFDKPTNGALEKALEESREGQHTLAVNNMREAIIRKDEMSDKTIRSHYEPTGEGESSGRVAAPAPVSAQPQPQPQPQPQYQPRSSLEPQMVGGEVKKPDTFAVKSSIIDLANNDVFSVATIQEQAGRINKQGGDKEDEVFISLH